MDSLTLQGLQNAVDGSAERTAGLVALLNDQIRFDPGSGRAEIADRDEIVRAYGKYLGDDAAVAGEEVVAMLADGFAQLNGGAKQTIAMPWRALERRDVAGMLTGAQWEQLGFRPHASGDQVRKMLGSGKIGEPPAYLFEDLAIDALARWAERRRVIDIVDTIALPRNGGGGFGGGGGAGGGDVPPAPPRGPQGGGSGSGTPPIPQETQDDIMKIITGSAECLMKASWSIEGIWGVRVCLDRKCADTLESILLGTGGANASAMLGYFLANFGKITFSSVLKSAGGWVGLALLHFSLYWGLLIRSNKTANGVCLIHVWPWWSGLTGGAFHGWAVGR